MILTFEQAKHSALTKKDKSTKGSVDVRIKPLLEVINAHPDYYTTSSCSGRILLLHGDSKAKSRFLFCSHDPIASFPIVDVPIQGTVWLKCEGAILHVACKTIPAAWMLVKAAQNVGFKHSGIISCAPKIVVEIKSAEYLATPLYNHAQPIFTTVHPLIDICTKKLAKNFQLLDAFHEKVTDILCHNNV